MTDEELQQTIQGLTESIDGLSDPDKPLTKEDKKEKNRLLLRRDVLERIKGAREKNDKNAELSYTATYGLLTSFGEKHPFLMRMVRSKFWINM